MIKVNRYFLFLSFCFSFVLANHNATTDELFKKVAMQREGLSSDQLTLLKSPFRESKQTYSDAGTSKDTYSDSFVIRAIINDRVKVNEKWYSVGDNIYGSTIQKILSSGVLIKNNDGKEEIKLIVRESANVKIGK